MTYSGPNLTVVTFPDNSLLTYIYDAGHRLTSAAIGAILTTTYSYAVGTELRYQWTAGLGCGSG
jgi:hypothetical protein